MHLSEFNRKGRVVDWAAVGMLNMVWWWTLQWTRGMPQITALKMDTAPASLAWYLISHMPVLCLVEDPIGISTVIWTLMDPNGIFFV